MRALLITHDFLPNLPGGIANYLYRLCHDLAPDLDVLAPVYGDSREFDQVQPFCIHRRAIPVEPPAFMRESRWHVLRLPYIFYVVIVQMLFLVWHGLRVARQCQAQALLVGHLYLAPLGWLLGRLLDLPYGVIVYGGELHRYFSWPPVRRILLAALDRARFLITITEFTRRQYLERGVRSDQTFVLVYPGVDTERFRPDADGVAMRQRYGLDGGPLILTVARLVDWKGHDLVLRALVHHAAPGA